MYFKFFKTWLENWDEEQKKINILNQTQSLPFMSEPKNISTDIGQLTRGFHINTVVGRMMQPWIGTAKKFESIKNNIASSMKKQLNRNVFLNVKRQYINDNGELNQKFDAAYNLFKSEISDAVHNLPQKFGHDIHSGNQIDVTKPIKSFFSQYAADENKHIFASLDSALKIQSAVFDSIGYSQYQNFINFLELLKEEFMTYGENLPNLSQPRLEKIQGWEAKIDEKIRQYQKLQRIK